MMPPKFITNSLMSAMAAKMTAKMEHAVLHTEGCALHYWHCGHGPTLITFVPGGNGHGLQFLALMAALADTGKYTCATFDRRQMSASVVTDGVNKKFNPPQQARDIRAVISVLGFAQSIIFGSSSGGILSLQFAHDFPDMVIHLISHEAPTFILLPDAAELFEWFHGLMTLYETKGLEAAAAEFESKLTGYDDEGIPTCVSPDPKNRVNFWENEIPILIGGYVSNLWRVKENGTSVGVMRGVRCKDAFFARATVEQAKILGCPLAVVPGHHQGFEVETEAFLPAFLEMIETLEKRKKGSAISTY
ncbi:Alpha/Beta hydrolase protein [Apodospora peruviana]|uniref:Alpha/Beta hydrolase protein n=1 Tax=Apodospora peruviana TaxID=516989 RepID=A0AAE0IJ40_9PEZI|nr:Alpha/Beta hydrolase protein [Apodospora peruviana]